MLRPEFRESIVASKILQKANWLKDQGLYPFFRAIEKTTGQRVVVGGVEQIMIGSNNYLGLTHHPLVQEAAIRAIEKYGTGCTGSRFLNGNLTIHEELEDQLAKYTGHDKALVFATGMQSNLGAISSMCGPRDCMFFDSENHASLIDATRLSFGTTYKYKHNDMEGLANVIRENRHKYQKAMIVADGVFSMTGDIMNLPEVVKIAREYDCLVYVDDAHGLGVMGRDGRGTMDHFDLTDQVDINMGTFSKSFASIGGFISGQKDIMDFIKHSARSFMFSAAMPPSAVATVSKSLELVTTDKSILNNLWNNVAFIRQGFKDIGLYTYNSQTPIVPVFIGDDILAMQVTRFLQEHGVFATPVIGPAVPPGEALIRTSYMSIHTRDELERVLGYFKLAKKTFNLPGEKH
jgi:8-amino-7-oxononanoate synthase